MLMNLIMPRHSKTWDQCQTKKIARICWNTNGWTCPSGRIGKSKNKDSYEYKYGFGHEEWLFDIAKTINGYHYGHIQAVASYKENLSFDLSLFTINDKTKQRYWVGEILDVEPVFNKEAKTILSEYKKKGLVCRNAGTTQRLHRKNT